MYSKVFTDGPVMPELSLLEKEALEFADAELEKAGPHVPCCGSYDLDPANATQCKARQLMMLYKQARRDFENLLAGKSVEDPTVQEAAKRCLYLGYAIGYLTLKNLPADVKFLYHVHRVKVRDVMWPDDRLSYTKLLSRHHDTYQGFAILMLAQVYLRLRGHVEWNSEACAFRFPQEIPRAYAARFFQKDSFEDKARRLHNALCGRAWLYLSKEELVTDPDLTHFTSWLKEDVPGTAFAPPQDLLTQRDGLDPLGLPKNLIRLSTRENMIDLHFLVNIPAPPVPARMP